jgi:hypothetical protein
MMGYVDHQPIADPPRMLRLALCAAMLASAIQAGHTLDHAQAKVLADWRAGHPEFAAAADSDCHCEEDIGRMRAGYGGAWMPQPDYHPYVAAGDFKGDGQIDFAVVLISPAKPDHRFGIVIFNGPFETRKPQPAFLKTGLDLQGQGLFYGTPRPKPHRLLLGRFESEGVPFVPRGGTYALAWP